MAKSVTNAIYLLCAEPEKYLQELREEVTEHSLGGRDFTKNSLHKMVKLDSFLRESGRAGSVGIVASLRYARSDFQFKDGTRIPAGTILGTNVPALHHTFPDLGDYEKFDGFRYSRLQEETGVEQLKLGSTRADHLAFGHGRHACPGRHFAALFMKFILANLILRYDMKLKPGTAPQRSHHSLFVIPEMKLKILMKSVAARD